MRLALTSSLVRFVGGAVVQAAPAFLWGNQGQKLEGGRVPVRRSTLEAHDGYAPEGMSGYNSEPAAKPSNVAPNGETDAMIEHYFQRIGLEGVTCEILAASGGCDGWGDEYAYMCPVTCGQPLGASFPPPALHYSKCAAW